MRILIDITDPSRPFVHKGGRRKSRRYVAFRTTRIGAPDWYSRHGAGWLVP